MSLEEAFREINGRSMSEDEMKRALAIKRVVKEVDLDPILLFFLADANAAVERERIPSAIRLSVDNGLKRLRTAIPTAETITAVKDDVSAAHATISRFHDLIAATSRWLAFATAVSTFIVVLVVVFSWRSGYDVGWQTRDAIRNASLAQHVCGALDRMRHVLRTQEAQVGGIDRERARYGC